MAQVTVVSKGMKWSQEAANKAAEQHHYIKVGDKAGHLLLSGAAGRWNQAQNAGDVYVPSLRVAGSPQKIRELFAGLGVPAVTVNQHLAAAYTKDNVKTTMKANFDAELAAYKRWKEAQGARKAVAGPTVTLGQLQYFVDQLASSAVVARTATGSPRAGSPKEKKARGGDLAKRLAAAVAKGKVLDVSNYDPVKKSGVSTIKKPGPSSKKVGVEGLAIVSSNPQLYAAVVRELGPGYEKFIAQYDALVAAKQQVTAAAPVLGSPRSPRVPTFPAATSPAAGFQLPQIPGVGQAGLPAAIPVGSPVGSPVGL